MNRKILVLLLATLILVACSSSVKMRTGTFSKEQSPNLIENGGFEIYQEEIGTSIPGWTFDISPNEKVEIDTMKSFTGSNSLKISKPSKEITMISESFTTNHRNVYGFNLAAMSTSQKVPVVMQFITFSNSGKIVSKYKTTAMVGANWETHTFTADYLKPNSQFGRLFITVYPSDSVILLDDISCQIIDTYQKK